MARQAFAGPAGRHRLLEGFLLRLARHDHADAFALRGGMLVRHWFPDAGRPARDLDLVCRLPFDTPVVREQIAHLLADDRIDDGVRFDAERFRTDVIWAETPVPGIRLFAAGKVDGWSAEMSVDLTFHLDIWPDATRDTVTTAAGEARIWTCRPAMLIGRKLQVIGELGHRHWRPKDLGDVWLMLRDLEPDRATLGEAIERSYLGHDTSQPIDAILATTAWWHDRRAAHRWQRHAHAIPGLPDDLDAVVDEVRARLAPFVSTTT